VKFATEVLRSPWLIALLGVFVFGVAALPKNLVIAGSAYGGLDNIYWQLAVAVLAVALICAGLWFGWLNTRTNVPQADPLPIESIAITSSTLSGLSVTLSGDVSPKGSGVNVWILRQDQGGGGAGLSVSPGYATTDSDGHWSHTASLWPSGPFVVNAVVTTGAHEALFRYYRRAFEAATKMYKAANPAAKPSLSGWPLLESLPQPSVCDSRTITLPPGTSK
jgi:hypothetical protein